MDVERPNLLGKVKVRSLINRISRRMARVAKVQNLQKVGMARVVKVQNIQKVGMKFRRLQELWVTILRMRSARMTYLLVVHQAISFL